MTNSNTEIPKLILDHLLRYGETSVAGLGTFTLHRQHAKFSSDRSALQPPSHEVAFNKELSSVDQFIHFVHNRLGASVANTRSIVKQYTEQIQERLDQSGKVAIDNIGTLAKSGNQVIFAPSDYSSQAEYYGLSTVGLKPIQFLKSEVAPQMPAYDVSTDDVIYKKANQSGLINILSAIGLALLTMLCYKACSDSSFSGNNPIKNQIENVIESPVEGDPSEVDGSEIANSINDEDDSDEEINNTEEAVTEHTVNKATECVIILGAYESATNAMKMSSKISNMGYEPYEEYFDTMDLTRVGFKFDCGDKDLERFMKDIRKNVTQDAWYLVPRITVE